MDSVAGDSPASNRYAQHPRYHRLAVARNGRQSLCRLRRRNCLDDDCQTPPIWGQLPTIPTANSDKYDDRPVAKCAQMVRNELRSLLVFASTTRRCDNFCPCTSLGTRRPQTSFGKRNDRGALERGELAVFIWRFHAGSLPLARATHMPTHSRECNSLFEPSCPKAQQFSFQLRCHQLEFRFFR